MPPALRAGYSDRDFLRLAREDGWMTAVQVLTDSSVSASELHARFGSVTAAIWSVLLPAASRNRILLAHPFSVAEVLAAAHWFKSTYVLTGTETDRELLGVCAEQACCRGIRILGGIEELRSEPRFDVVSLSSDRLALLLDGLRTNADELAHVWCVNHARPWNRAPKWIIGNPTSLRRLRRDLAGLGLGQQRHFAVLPDHSSPEQIFRLARGARRQPALHSRRQSMQNRIKTGLQARAEFCPASCLIASAVPLEQSWVESLAEYLCDRLSLPTPARRFPDLLVSHAEGGGGLLLLVDSDVVVRVPFRAEARKRIENNHRALTEMQQLRAAGLRCQTPEPLLLEEFDGILVGVESRLAGTMADRTVGDAKVKVEQCLFDLLLQFQRIGPGPRAAAGHWNANAVAPYERLHAWCSTTAQHRMIDDIVDFLRSAATTGLPMRRCHGDFKLANALVGSSHGRLGLIDWDLYRDAHFATIDFCHFLMHRRAWMHRKSRQLALVDWLQGVRSDEAEMRWTVAFAESLELRGHWKQLAALTYWVREFANRVGTVYDLRSDWIETKFRGLLPAVHRQVIESS
jgi:aminoglycoside phosphotransferase (APT) family kinase protein